MTSAFSPEPRLAQLAQAYARDAAQLAAKQGVTLDGTDGSIARLEQVLDRLAAERILAKPSDEQIWRFAQIFGSYLGETFRRNHGGEWGVVSLNGETVAGMRARKSGVLFWPWVRVRNRIVDGAEDDVRTYYADLVRRS